MTDSDDSSRPLLTKWLAGMAAAFDADLTRSAVAIYMALLEHGCPPGWISWPSHATLSALARVSRNSVLDAISLLVKAGYIEVVERGGPNRNTRYRVTLKGADQVLEWKRSSWRSASSLPTDSTATAQGQLVAATAPDGAMPPGSSGRAQAQRGTTHHMANDERCGTPKEDLGVPNRAGHEFNHQSEQQVRIDGCGVGGPSSASPTTVPALAGSPDGDRPASGGPARLQHDWFWSVYPRHEGTARADQLLTDLLAAGESQDAIEAGAKSYRAMVDRRRLESKFIAMPANWLGKKRWLDRYDADAAPAPAPDAPVESRNEAGKAGNAASQGVDVGDAESAATLAAVRELVAGRPMPNVLTAEVLLGAVVERITVDEEWGEFSQQEDRVLERLLDSLQDKPSGLDVEQLKGRFAAHLLSGLKNEVVLVRNALALGQELRAILPFRFPHSPDGVQASLEVAAEIIRRMRADKSTCVIEEGEPEDLARHLACNFFEPDEDGHIPSAFDDSWLHTATSIDDWAYWTADCQWENAVGTALVECAETLAALRAVNQGTEIEPPSQPASDGQQEPAQNSVDDVPNEVAELCAFFRSVGVETIEDAAETIVRGLCELKAFPNMECHGAQVSRRILVGTLSCDPAAYSECFGDTGGRRYWAGLDELLKAARRGHAEMNARVVS